MSDYYLKGAHRDESKILWHQNENAVYFPIDAVVTPRQAMILAGMYHYTVEKLPLFALVGNQKVALVDDTGEPNKFVLAITNQDWQDDPVFFNRTVGTRYQPMQNARLAELVEGLAAFWPVEGVMMLKNGEITVVQLKLDEYYIGERQEEKHLSYLVVAVDYTQGSIMWLETDVRVVCWNTYSMSLAAIDKLRIPNSTNADATLGFLAKVQEKTVEAQLQRVTDLNALFKAPMTTEQFSGIIEAAVPDPKESSRMKIAQLEVAAGIGGELGKNFFSLVDKDKANVEWREGRAAQLRTEIGGNLVKFNDNHPYAANTLYAGFQAVTDLFSNSESFTGTDDKKAISRMLGNNKALVESAYSQALEYAGLG